MGLPTPSELVNEPTARVYPLFAFGYPDVGLVICCEQPFIEV
jgi:hypothetical protein